MVFSELSVIPRLGLIRGISSEPNRFFQLSQHIIKLLPLVDGIRFLPIHSDLLRIRLDPLTGFATVALDLQWIQNLIPLGDLCRFGMGQ